MGNAGLKHRFLHHTYWSYDEYFAKYLRYTKWGALDYWYSGCRVTHWGPLICPFLRFFQLYVLRMEFLDGLVGIQACMLQSFFVTFVKRTRLWEMEYSLPQPDPEPPARFYFLRVREEEGRGTEKSTALRGSVCRRRRTFGDPRLKRSDDQ